MQYIIYIDGSLWVYMDIKQSVPVKGFLCMYKKS